MKFRQIPVERNAALSGLRLRDALTNLLELWADTNSDAYVTDGRGKRLTAASLIELAKKESAAHRGDLPRHDGASCPQR
jgi:hypothetical protein